MAAGVLVGHLFLLCRARQPAEVAYYGAAPQGVAGFLQVNAKVPESIASGNAEVVIQIGTSKSQTGLTVAVQ